MKLKPVRDYLLIKIIPVEEKKGALLLLKAPTDEPRRARVLDTGDECKTSVKAGDIVLLPYYGGTKVPGGGDQSEQCLLVSEKEILGIVIDDE